jgi:hypothetical protein
MMTASFAVALALTLAVEAPVVGWYGRRMGRTRGHVIAAGLLPSLVTHPIAWHAWSRLSPYDLVQGIAMIETAVWLVEAALLLILLRLKWKQALLLSLVANAASMSLACLML